MIHRVMLLTGRSVERTEPSREGSSGKGLYLITVNVAWLCCSDVLKSKYYFVMLVVMNDSTLLKNKTSHVSCLLVCNDKQLWSQIRNNCWRMMIWWCKFLYKAAKYNSYFAHVDSTALEVIGWIQKVNISGIRWSCQLITEVSLFSHVNWQILWNLISAVAVEWNCFWDTIIFE